MKGCNGCAETTGFRWAAYFQEKPCTKRRGKKLLRCFQRMPSRRWRRAPAERATSRGAGNRSWRAYARRVVEAVHAVAKKSRAPVHDHRASDVQPLRDLEVPQAVCGREHDSSPHGRWNWPSSSVSPTPKVAFRSSSVKSRCGAPKDQGHSVGYDEVTRRGKRCARELLRASRRRPIAPEVLRRIGPDRASRF